MPLDNDFLQKVTEGLNRKTRDLDKTVASGLKEDFRSLQSNFGSLLRLCYQKGLLKEDPYKKEKSISELKAIPDTPLPESYKEDELAIRLSDYDSQLEYLNHYMSFSMENLNLKRIKELNSILKCIRWAEFNPTSTKPNTRAFAEVLEKIKRGSDNISSGALTSSVQQLEKINKSIVDRLKQIATYKRLEYKHAIRENILIRLSLGTSVPKEIFTKEIKKIFAQSLPGTAYFPDLVEELYDEEFGPNKEELIEKTLKLLVVEKKSVVKAPQKDMLKNILLEGIRNLGNSTRHLEICSTKIKSNHQVLQQKPKTFMEKFRAWIISLSSKGPKEISYEVELMDLTTGARINKTIGFQEFISRLNKKSRNLSGTVSKTSAISVKLEQAEEEQVYLFLEKNLTEIIEIHKILEGLDNYFKTEVEKFEREKIRGIKNELAAIKGHIHHANQRKHEYIARKDEQAQLQKLGISTN